jgi:glycosyltransferase involved in cell wall biosynthesis
MKILVIQDFLRSGGTERQSILLANAFARARHTTGLLTFRPGGALDSTVAPAVMRRALQPFDLGMDWFAPGLSSEVRRFAPQVILCMGRMANTYARSLQGEFPSVSVVATMRTGRPLSAPMLRSFTLARHIVANSHEARDTLVSGHRISAEKISVIHNALVFPAMASTHDAAARTALRSQFGASPKTLVLLCVAMFRPGKNQRLLIETVVGLPRELDWQLWLVGEGPERRACEDYVAQNQLEPRVKFIGFVPEPSAYYVAADVAVHASASEALSNFIIESQAHGLPAVVYQAQGMEECFRPNESGWAIPPSDLTGFRQALIQLAHEPAPARAARALAAQTFARDTFDPQRQVAAYLALFARLTPATHHQSVAP